MLSAVANAELRVLMPLVLKTGPLPEVLGVATLTPFSRRHEANLASACLACGVFRLVPKRPRPGTKPAPHFFRAAS